MTPRRRHLVLTPPPRPRPDWMVLAAALLVLSVFAAMTAWQAWRTLDVFLDLDAAHRLPPAAIAREGR